MITSSGKEHVAGYKLLKASGESVWFESHLTFVAGLFLVKVIQVYVCESHLVKKSAPMRAVLEMEINAGEFAILRSAPTEPRQAVCSTRTSCGCNRSCGFVPTRERKKNHEVRKAFRRF